jgi:hypothetical protein
VVGNFLVMVKNFTYLVRFDGAETVCTKVPSTAEHYSYRVADRIVCILRSRGFSESLVATLNGLPATTQAILDTSSVTDEFTVRFNGSFLFAGRDVRGEPLGSRDPMEAKSMSRAAAQEVCSRLKRMKFKDAEIIEFASVDNTLESELKRVWGSGVETTPESVTIES